MVKSFISILIITINIGIGTTVANTTCRLATPTTTSNMFAAAGGPSMKTIGGGNSLVMDPNQV